MPHAKIPSSTWAGAPSRTLEAREEDTPLPLAVCWAIWIAFAGCAWALLFALFGL